MFLVFSGKQSLSYCCSRLLKFSADSEELLPLIVGHSVSNILCLNCSTSLSCNWSKGKWWFDRRYCLWQFNRRCNYIMITLYTVNFWQRQKLRISDQPVEFSTTAKYLGSYPGAHIYTTKWTREKYHLTWEWNNQKRVLVYYSSLVIFLFRI